MMNLKEHIREVGLKKFAKKFNVTERTVQYWLDTDRVPQKRIAVEIVKKTPVTYAGLYGAEKNTAA